MWIRRAVPTPKRSSWLAYGMCEKDSLLDGWMKVEWLTLLLILFQSLRVHGSSIKRLGVGFAPRARARLEVPRRRRVWMENRGALRSPHLSEGLGGECRDLVSWG